MMTLTHTESPVSGVPFPTKTTTLPDGQIVTSKSGILIWGTNTVTVPTRQSTPLAVTLHGETFTFGPHPGQTPGAKTETLPDGVIATSSSGLLIWGTNTLTVPTGLAYPLTTTAHGEIFTFQPTELPAPTTLPTTIENGPVMTKLLPGGDMVTSSAGILIWGTNTLSVPQVLSDPVTTTVLGEVFTFMPTNLPLSTGNIGQLTRTLPDGAVFTSYPGFLVWGTNTISVPATLTTKEVLTTDGEVFTFFPPAVAPSETSTTTEAKSKTPEGTKTNTESLVIFTTWPATVSIIPVKTSVTAPQASDNKPVVPCKAWFFFVRVQSTRNNFSFGEREFPNTKSVFIDLYFVECQCGWMAVDIATRNISTVCIPRPSPA